MNLFDLFVKIGIKDEASDQLPGIADKLKGGLATAGKVAAAGVAAAATAVGALTKAAVDSYAETEQLRGGVETLFKTSADTVMAYAENAYKTAGMSANEYMTTVTSFSASLLQSLGEDAEEAAEYANRAVVSMSDNANKMGTDISMIQNAYQGFAKQNYTMLDNLKIGYGGTQKEMQRLIEDASKMTDVQEELGITVDGSSMSFGNIVNAIQVMQSHMGIAGATADEAAETISGSLSAMKSAWENLVVGIADDNANMDTLIANFVESVGVAGENVLPRVEQVLIGIGDLITNLAPLAVEAVSDLITDVLPSALEAGASLLVAVGEGITSNFDYLLQTAFDLILYLTDSLISSADGLIDGAVQIVESLAMWIEEYSDVLIEKAMILIMTLVEGIAQNLPQIVLAAAQIIGALATGVIDYLPDLVKQVPTIIAELVAGFKEALPDIISVGEDIVKSLWEGIQNLAGWLGEKVSGFFGGIVEKAKDLFGGDDKPENKPDKGGIDGGTGSVSYSNSGLGSAAKTIAGSSGGTIGDVVVNVTSEVGGSAVARKQYKYNAAEAQRRGTSLVVGAR